MFIRCILIFLVISLPLPVHAQVRIGPAEIEREIYGQRIKVVFYTDLSVKTEGNAIALGATLSGDLSDLQSKFKKIIDTIRLPRNNCPSYGTHVLPRIRDAVLKASGTQAIIGLAVDATVWQCARNPVPETVCRMVTKCVDLGIARPCTDLPECSFRDGSPIKTILVEEGFFVDLPFHVTSKNGTTIEIVSGSVDIRPRGDIGKFVNQIAGIFNADLNTLATKEIDKLFDEGVLRLALPQDLRRYNLTIHSVSFTSHGGRLGLEAHFSGRASAAQLTEFLEQLLASEALK